MPEAVMDASPATESMGWRAGLPDDLKTNAAFLPFKTVGEFGKDYLAVKTKATELEGKLADYVPKLPDNATDEDRNLYYDALGRPKQPSEYEFDGEDKNAPEWTNFWKAEMHNLGLTKAQAKALSGKFNGQIQKLVETHNASLQQEMATARQKFQSEMGDKFDTNVELAKRMWTKYGDGDLDSVFPAETSAARFQIIRTLLKFAEKTGEDTSPQAGKTVTPAPDGNPYPKSNMPTARIPAGTFAR